jgi:hypothetical protein
MAAPSSAMIFSDAFQRLISQEPAILPVACTMVPFVHEVHVESPGFLRVIVLLIFGDELKGLPILFNNVIYIIHYDFTMRVFMGAQLPLKSFQVWYKFFDCLLGNRFPIAHAASCRSR